MEDILTLNIEPKTESSILDSPLTEGTKEIVDPCPSMNPEVHVDAANSGNKEIPVPGGDKETPEAKEHQEITISVPGGDKEKPDAKDHQEVNVPAAQKVLIDEDTYNQALDALKKSFKESYELLESITQMQIVPSGVKHEQDEFMENALDDAYETAYLTGPMYETVSRKEDKENVKGIVDDIRDDVKDYIKGVNKAYKFYKPVRILRLMTSINADTKNIIKPYSAWWSTRLFQVLGNVVCDEHAIKDITKQLNQKFADKLDGYKIIAYEVSATFIDLFRKRFGIKNTLQVYFLFIDKSVPAEIKKLTEADKAEVDPEQKAE